MLYIPSNFKKNKIKHDLSTHGYWSISGYNLQDAEWHLEEKCFSPLLRFPCEVFGSLLFSPVRLSLGKRNFSTEATDNLKVTFWQYQHASMSSFCQLTAPLHNPERQHTENMRWSKTPCLAVVSSKCWLLCLPKHHYLLQFFTSNLW